VLFVAELGRRNFAQDRCFFDTLDMDLKGFVDAASRLPGPLFAFLLSPRGRMFVHVLQW
jgi:hypothetical protein